MSINTKGKRKLIFSDQLFYWYVKEDPDSLDHYVYILSEDCTVYLSYQIDQVRDYFIHPKIKVLKSDRLAKGTYLFAPALADSFISKQHVCAILNWYYAQPKDAEPLKMDFSDHPFENIDFKKGEIEYIESDLSLNNLKEDLLQVHFPNNYVLDVGYYGTTNAFIIYVIQNQDWQNPVYKVSRGWYSLRETIINAIDWIDKQ